MADTAAFRRAANVLAMELVDFGTSLTSEQIDEAVNIYRVVFSQPPYSFTADDFENLRKELEVHYTTTMDAGTALVDPTEAHDEEWYKAEQIDWGYWNDYRNHLINTGWHSRVIGRIDEMTNDVLGLLQNPAQDGSWIRKGLIMGHVQSGKTANYIGLMAKAADAGYRFIIVLAGTQNNLRAQTQLRVEEGFIGRDSSTEDRQRVGVGKLRPDRPFPVTLTTRTLDFREATQQANLMDLRAVRTPLVLVVKKNATVLAALYRWLHDLNTTGAMQTITSVPMLLIDDEADNASINTSKDEYSPTRINAEIRRILRLFSKRCYVGYTATPFANIFISPDSDDAMLGDDLFPEHFIYCLEAPSNYFGPDKVFLDYRDHETDYGPFVRSITDMEDVLPLTHKKGHPIRELPLSLQRALRVFVLSRAIRSIWGQSADHSTMMVNVSRFVGVQHEIRNLIVDYVEMITNRLRYHCNLPFSKALGDQIVREFFADFESEYGHLDPHVNWTDVQQALVGAAESVRVVVVNSLSQDTLDYAGYSREGMPLTVIAVGGLALSRGLTLEGLTVSYVYRNSTMYDTLMQMGRWFGYRDGYEDLCRIWMSEESIGWYAHIAEAIEELRARLRQMKRIGKKPSDFGLYVRAHPDALIVTALNKMRYAENLDLRVSYDGRLVETHIVSASSGKNSRNLEKVRQLYQRLEHPNGMPDIRETRLVRDVRSDIVADFVAAFEYHPSMYEMAESVPAFVAAMADEFPDWDVAFLSKSDAQPGNGLPLSPFDRSVGTDGDVKPRRPPGDEAGWYIGNKQRVSGNSMFAEGLSKGELDSAREHAALDERRQPIFRDYTNARGKPLLIVLLVHLKHGITDLVGAENIPVIGVSFPNSRSGITRSVAYTVNQVYLQNLKKERVTILEDDEYDTEL